MIVDELRIHFIQCVYLQRHEKVSLGTLYWEDLVNKLKNIYNSVLPGVDEV